MRFRYYYFITNSIVRNVNYSVIYTVWRSKEHWSVLLILPVIKTFYVSQLEITVDHILYNHPQTRFVETLGFRPSFLEYLRILNAATPVWWKISKCPNFWKYVLYYPLQPSITSTACWQHRVVSVWIWSYLIYNVSKHFPQGFMIPFINVSGVIHYGTCLSCKS